MTALLAHRRAWLAAALCAAASPAPSQCQPHGTARLFLSGLRQPGQTLTFRLTGAPSRPFAILGSGTSAPVPLPWGGDLCVGPLTFLVFSGSNMPIDGDFQLAVPVSPNPSIIGTQLFFQGVIADPTAPGGLLSLSNTIDTTMQGSTVTTIRFEDFELGTGLWSATNGVWQIGAPAYNGMQAWSGTNCAATNLAGDYPDLADTTLLDRPLSLPAIGPGEEIRIAYKIWFATENGYDWCQLVVDGAPVPDAVAMSGYGAGWIDANVDLSAFAGQQVRIGFRFASNGCCTRADGVYLDDIHVYRGVPVVPAVEDWEEGIGPWWSCDNGVWQVGTPTAGCSPYSGTQCAATVLDGNYPDLANSKLISPPITLGTAPLLAFWHCFSTETGYDYGVVRVATRQPNGTWGTWSDITPHFSGSSTGWTQVVVDLSAHASETVRFAFDFLSNGCCTRSTGWYIDDIRVL